MKLKFIVALIALLGVSACDKSRPGRDVMTDVPVTPVIEPKTFGLKLTGLEVRRISNGDKLEVQVSGVASGEITLAE